MANQFKRGTEVRYCHEGADRRAQVSEVDKTGAVRGINVLVLAGEDDNGNKHWHTDFGVANPKLATSMADRVDGCFWTQE